MESINSGTTSSMISPESIALWGNVHLSTHRDKDLGADAVVYFQYEAALAALSIFFFRATVVQQQQHGGGESSIRLLRWFFSILLAGLAFNKKSYELILAVEIFSFVVPRLLPNTSSRTSTMSASKKNKSTSSSSSSSSSESSTTSNNNNTQQQQQQRMLLLTLLLRIAASAVACILVSHLLVTGILFQFLRKYIIPNFVMQLFHYLFPVQELKNAYDILLAFAADPVVLQKQLEHLLFVTFHIQVGIGYLGINFLTKEQHRRNQLIRMDMDVTAQEENEDAVEEQENTQAAAGSSSRSDDSNGNNGSSSDSRTQQSSATRSSVNGNQHNNHNNTQKESRPPKEEEDEEKRKLRVKLARSRRFQRSAAPFIFFTAIPYMTKIIIMGNANQFAFTCFQHDLHRVVRLNQLFDHESHLTAVALESTTSPEAYANSMSSVVDTAYSLFNRKLFSLPKVLLLPSVMSRQPMLLVQIFPFIFLSDYLKAYAVAYMTTWVEDLQKEIRQLSSIQSRIESFDIKNAELLQRSGKGATQYTQRRWQSLVVQIQERVVLSDLITRTKHYFSWIQRNFVFSVLVDCALANLMAIGKLVAADIFVFSRAIEDTVDLILMRSRSEAELARMETEIEKLSQLVDIWERSQERSLVHCTLPPSSSASSQPPRSGSSGGDEHGRHRNLILRNLHYSRGTASVRADHVELEPGVYALTGPNGSGKSTLFRVLMSCHTNEKPIDLPSSINLLTPMAPLVEKDDLIREACCHAEHHDNEEGCVFVNHDDDDDNDEQQPQQTEQECAADYSSSCSEEGGDVSRALSSPANDKIDPMRLDHVPKLSVTMPSTHVIEISQTFYWPLYSRPIDWIYQENVLEACEPSELQRRIRKVALELYSLDFLQPVQVQLQDKNDTNSEGGNDDDETSEPQLSPEELEEAGIVRIMDELQQEKEDWFGDLSGGQKSKVELVRLVFMQDQCPEVLLVDETMAPLDPASKSLVMKKLKDFCRHSIIIVIYHTDVQQQTSGDGEGAANGERRVAAEECVQSNDFFDQNIHLEHGILHLRDTC